MNVIVVKVHVYAQRFVGPILIQLVVNDTSLCVNGNPILSGALMSTLHDLQNRKKNL